MKKHFIIIIIYLLVTPYVWAKSPPPGAGAGNVPANVLIMLDTSGSMGWSVPTGDSRYPSDVAFDSAGNMYVAKYYDYVEKYDSSGNFVKKWGGYDYWYPSNARFRRLYSIAINSQDRIYVSDRYRSRVQVFNTNGNYLSKINVPGSQVYGVEIDSNDNVYIVDGNGRVRKYSSSGSLLQTWNNTSARYLAVDSSNNIYTSTWTNRQIKKYDSNGNLLMSFNTSFNNLGIEVDSSGNIFVSEYHNGKIHKYNSSGSFIQSYGSQGSGTGQFNRPRGITTDNSGTIWVANRLNHRIQDLSGNLFINPANGGNRLEQAKSAIRAMVSDSDLTSGAHFGLMSWNSYASMLVNISANGASQIFNTIGSLNPGGGTYLDSAMNLASSYFQGSNSPINPNASACQKNLLIVISDGFWYDNTASNTAQSLYDNHNITTFVVGFQTTGNSNYITLSQRGGTFPDSPLYTNNSQGLLEVLKRYITQIITTQLTFSAPTIMPGITSDDHIIQSTFKYKSEHQWKGHLKKYALNSDGSIGSQIWDAGSLLNNKLASARKLWTVGAGLSATDYNNFHANNVEDLRPMLEENASTTYTDEALSDLVNFVRGVDAYSEYPTSIDDEGTTLLSGERWKLADIYHSRAVIVGAPNAFVSDEVATNTEAYYRYVKSYEGFQSGSSCGSTCSARKEMVYVGSNGGMLHAFNSTSGQEEWGFLPPSVLPNFKDMIDLEAGKSVSIYGVDGTAIVKDIYYNNAWRTVLMSGLRQGGKSYFALDITDPDNPLHLFTFAHNSINNTVSYWDATGARTDYSTLSTIPTAFDFSALGESWSQPIIVNAPIDSDGQWVAVIGGGYNSGINSNYGSKVYIIDLENGGQIIKAIDITDGSSTNNIVNAVPPQLTAISADSSSLFTHQGAFIYFSDLEGKLWKINLSNQGVLYDKTQVFDMEATSSNGRYSFHALTSAITSDNIMMHFIGSGNTQSLSSTSSSINNRGFGIKDVDFPTYSNGTSFTASSLINTSGGGCPDASQKGWYLNLNSNEKMTGKATIKNGVVFFPRYTPDTSQICSAGSARVSQHDFVCGSNINSSDLGSGVPTEVIVYKNKMYVGISTDQSAPSLPSGFTKQGNIIVGTPSNVSTGKVKKEWWWEEF